VSRVVRMPPRATVDEQAAAWIARLDSDRMDACELRDLREWLEQGQEYREALERMAAVWDRLDVLEICRAALGPSAKVRQWRWLPLGLAAGLAALVGIGALVWYAMDGGIPWPAASPLETASTTVVHSTTIGERSSIPLPDGSIIELNTNSRIEVHYQENHRRVRLAQGEAFFEVASQPDRPFAVETDRGLIVAIGTAFSVRVEPASVEVTVQHGRVDVARKVSVESAGKAAPDSLDAIATLSPGQSLLFDEQLDSIDQLEPDQLARELAWRDGMLVFEGDPLSEVVAEVTRYDDLEIVISDPGLRGRRIGGYFPAGETDVLLAALEESFGIEVERVNDKLIYLHPVTP